jgi:hypothetical protein
VCCQVEVFTTGLSLVQRTPTECGVSKCQREASIMRGPGPLGTVAPWKKQKIHFRSSCHANKYFVLKCNKLNEITETNNLTNVLNTWSMRLRV